jgi:hypothetical protein
MPTGRRRLASSLRAAEPSSPNEAKALSNNPADNIHTPNDFADLGEVEERLLAFERRYEQSAAPFEWKFTRSDLALLMKKLADKPDYQAAA